MPSKANYTYRKKAILLTLILLVIASACIFIILFPDTPDTDETTVADIYHNGILLQSIILTDVKENYSFAITDENGSVNEIEVRPGSIGIISASCPDKLCVHQGFITSSQLPITCLPNRVVIQVHTQKAPSNIYEPTDNKEGKSHSSVEITPDIITY